MATGLSYYPPGMTVWHIIFESHGIVELELNMAKGCGWHGGSLEFLRKLPWLKAFRILDLTFPDVDPIHCLHNLKRLQIMTYCSTEIRFAAFPLEDCDLEWRPKADSLFECAMLKKLFVNRYKGNDVSGFGKLINLERLGILNSPVRDLLGLVPLSRLRKLRLNNLTKVESLRGLDALTNLEELDLRGGGANFVRWKN